MPAPAQIPAPAPPPLFRTARASDALLLGLKTDGAPERHYWDARRIQESQSSNSLFRLSSTTLPAIAERKKKKHDSVTSPSQASPSQASKEDRDDINEEEDSTEQATIVSEKADTASIVAEQPRRHKYYGLLMKHHNKRLDKDRKEEEQEEADRRENAANLAHKRRLQAEARAKRDDSDSSDEEVLEGDFGELTAYEGSMKVDLELVVMGAPKEKRKKKKDKEKKPREPRLREIVLPNGEVSYEVDSTYTPSASSSSGSYYSSSSSSSRTSSRMSYARKSSSSSSKTPSTKSSESTPRMDIAAELEALHEEVGSDTSSSSGSDGLPDDLKDKPENPWDNPHMRWTLGIGGTVFFVPDAERYGHAPSLPPPPPKSLLGRGRVNLKPRLPLDISNHRYRDEHPNVWPEDPYSPTKDDRRTFEQKLMTLDFYASCNKSLTRLPPLEREKDELKHEIAFGHLVERDTKHSFVWKAYVEKEQRRKKKEAEKRAREAAAAAAAEADPEDGSAELEAAEAAEDALRVPGLEAGASVTSTGSLGLPSESGGPGSGPR